jgi:hypothetical protein
MQTEIIFLQRYTYLKNNKLKKSYGFAFFYWDKFILKVVKVF